MEIRQLTDLLLAALYTVGAAVGLGLASVEILSYDLMATWTTISGYDIPYHMVAAAVGLLGAWVTNRPTFSRLSDQKKTLAFVAFGLLIASAFIPSTLEGLADQSILVAFLVLGVQTGGYWAIAHDQ